MRKHLVALLLICGVIGGCASPSMMGANDENFHAREYP